jgi:molybdopterin synthase catalytic subunit
MITLTDTPLDVRAIEDTVRDPGHGAILTFAGVARDTFGGRRVVALEYEAWAEPAVAELGRIAAEIAEKWPTARVAFAHRTGLVPIGEASVVVAVGAPHRDEAYAASRYAIDSLKARVPIWKKERYEDGEAWIANRP